MNKHFELSKKYSAKNYDPLPVVISRGEGVYVWDEAGKRYLDMLASYSAVNQGHRHPKIIEAAKKQLDMITITSRAFMNDKMCIFLEKICRISGFEMGLPMNTGAEAVETALKAARKWGEKKKNIPKDKTEIIVCENNFHGRTISIISFSSEEQYRDGFGPFTPGFDIVKYDDIDSISKAVTANTCAILIEPIQGEGGVNIPHDGYLKELRDLADKNHILLIFDEIQVGLGRCGTMFAFEYENIRPDLLILGKALGGGVYPVSIVLSDKEILGVFNPGDHGSTFGGNPLGCAVAIASLDVLVEEGLSEKSKILGDYFSKALRDMNSKKVKEVRSRGLMIGMEIRTEYGSAKKFCEALMEKGLLCKDTHKNTIRFTPPLVITKEQIDYSIEIIKEVVK